jgi:hypothetical protein
LPEITGKYKDRKDMKIRSRQLTEREELLICRALRSWEAGDTTEDKQKEALVQQITEGELLLIMRRDG